VTLGYDCVAGHYNPATETLRAGACTGSGPTGDIYVGVDTLDVQPNAPEDVSAVLYCTTFGVNSNQNWSGSCDIISD
jgi:hypothetical protein